MEENIKVLQSINAQYAAMFVTEALRYYANRVVSIDPSVPLVDRFRDSFQPLAQSYLDWEHRILAEVLKSIDEEEQQMAEGLYFTPEAADVDWRKIENEAISSL